MPAALSSKVSVLIAEICVALVIPAALIKAAALGSKELYELIIPIPAKIIIKLLSRQTKRKCL